MKKVQLLEWDLPFFLTSAEGSGIWGYWSTMENGIEKNMEHKMEAGILFGLNFEPSFSPRRTNAATTLNIPPKIDWYYVGRLVLRGWGG